MEREKHTVSAHTHSPSAQSRVKMVCVGDVDDWQSKHHKLARERLACGNQHAKVAHTHAHTKVSSECLIPAAFWPRFCSKSSPNLPKVGLTNWTRNSLTI